MRCRETGKSRAGCGADNGAGSPGSVGADSSVGAAGSSAGSAGGTGTDDSVAGQGSPAYDPGDRQVLTVVVAFPWPDDLQEILEYNANSQTYFLETKTCNNVGTEREAEKLATQLNLEILSGKGPDLVLWNCFYTPALASEKLTVDLYDFMDREPDFHREDYYENNSVPQRRMRRYSAVLSRIPIAVPGRIPA